MNFKTTKTNVVITFVCHKLLFDELLFGQLNYGDVNKAGRGVRKSKADPRGDLSLMKFGCDAV